MTKDIALAIVCLGGFLFFLFRAESRGFTRWTPQRYEWLEGATATNTSTWTYTTADWRYAAPHGIRQWMHNLRYRLRQR